MNIPAPIAKEDAASSQNELSELREWTSINELAEKLHAIEQRLGTPAEQTDDEQQARELGHDIRNRLNLLQLRAEFRKMMLGKALPCQQTA